MSNEILIFLISVGLLLFLFYRERQYEKSLRDILAAKLSQDASEFKFATEKEKPVEEKKAEPEEIPLEELSAEEMLKALKKEK